jgi:hypothetical protein
MNLDLTDEEAAALARDLPDALDYSCYPFAPRLEPLKSGSWNRKSLGRNRCRR